MTVLFLHLTISDTIARTTRKPMYPKSGYSHQCDDGEHAMTNCGFCAIDRPDGKPPTKQQIVETNKQCDTACKLLKKKVRGECYFLKEDYVAKRDYCQCLVHELSIDHPCHNGC
ncbi:hypothetical protein HDE_04930 [Halotydeus destructor]|nr:hypothetical protein HDE_04930 [Halotydeus destructor]